MIEIKKPTPEAISFYEYLEVKSYIYQKYGLDDKVFEKWLLDLNPIDGQLLYLHIGDYIACKKYDSDELLKWLKSIEIEFGSVVVIEWEDN